MTKDRLRNYRHLLLEKRQLEDLIGDLEASMLYPKVQQLTGMPGSASPDGRAMEETVIRHQELVGRYVQKLGELDRECRAIEEAIAALPSVERTLMRARYIEGRKWEEVCCVINYSWQQTHRLHAQALAKLAEKDQDAIQP